MFKIPADYYLKKMLKCKDPSCFLDAYFGLNHQIINQSTAIVQRNINIFFGNLNTLLS
jgi:hypothetical protein